MYYILYAFIIVVVSFNLVNFFSVDYINYICLLVVYNFVLFIIGSFTVTLPPEMRYNLCSILGLIIDGIDTNN